MGSAYTVMGGAALALVLWGATKLEDENHWDSEAVVMESAFKDYVKQQNRTVMDIQESRLRTEQRNISKEIRRIEGGEGTLTISEQRFLEVLNDQLFEVTKQQDELMLSNPD